MSACCSAKPGPQNRASEGRPAPNSLPVAIIGGGLGLALGWLIVSQGDPTGGMLPAFYLPVRDMLLGVALVVLLGLGTGLLPALQAQRLKIVDALRRA